MIQVALLSDVHGNLEALDAVLAHLRAHTPDAARYQLGDLVGYAANPNEVVARLADAGVAGVSGNYDSTVAHGYKHCGCRSENARQEELAHESFSWTLANTSAATRRQLAALPFRLDLRPLGGHSAGPRVVLVHAHTSNNLVYVTEDRPDDFLRKMGAAVDAVAGDVLAFGHTHKPWHRIVDGVHYINTGSVGRPKDGDPRAGFALLHLDAQGVHSVEHVRVPYDVELTASKLIAAGLPAEFAEFLHTGGRS